MVFLTGIAIKCTAVLNTVERFTVPALTGSFVPLFVVAGALMLHRQLGIWAMVFPCIAGAAAQTTAVAWNMGRCGHRLSLRWRGRNDATNEVMRQYAPLLLSAVVSSGGLLLDQAMAATPPGCSVSAMVFASRFPGVVVTLLAGAASSRFAPYLAAKVVERDWGACRRTLRRGSLLTAAVSVPIAAGILLVAPGLIRLTLQHGVFTARDTAVVAPVVAMFALQIPFVAVSRIDYRFVLAMGRTDLILHCGVLNLILDGVLDLVLMRYFGVAGLALATSLWTVSTWAFLRICSRRLLTRAEASSL